jgi:nitrogen regulatory protein P-II 1
MKEVKAFVRPEKVDKIVPALKEAGFKNISLTPGEGTGKQMDSTDAAPSLHFYITDSHIVKMELVCKDELTEKAIHIISEFGSTNRPGDGIIYISNVERVCRVKNCERL